MRCRPRRCPVEAREGLARPWWRGVAVVATTLLTAGVVRWRRGPSVSAPQAPVVKTFASLGVDDFSRRRALAVLVPRHDEADTRVALALREALDDELRAGEALRTVSTRALIDTERSFGAGADGAPAPDALAAAGRNVGADLVVDSELRHVKPEGSLDIRLRVVDAATGRVLSQASDHGLPADLLSHLPALAAAARAPIGLPSPPAADDAWAARLRGAKLEAIGFYAEARQREARDDREGAHRLLSEALQIDPALSQALAADAIDLCQIGTKEQGLAESQTVLAGVPTMPRADRLLLEASIAFCNAEPSGGMEALRTLYEAYSDDLEYLTSYADALAANGEGQKALTLLDDFAKRYPALATHPYLLFEEAQVCSYLAQRDRQAELAHRAAEEAAKRGLDGTRGEALFTEVAALIGSERPVEAEAVARDAVALFRQTGNRGRLAQTLFYLGRARRLQNDLPSSREANSEARELFRAIGDQRRVAVTSSEVGHAFRAEGRLDEAKVAYQEAVNILRGIGAGTPARRVELDASLSNLGYLLFLQGDLPAARGLYDESMVHAKEHLSTVLAGETTLRESLIDFEQGNIGAALTRASRGIEIHEAASRESLAASGRVWRALLLAARGRTDEAVADATKAMEAVTRLGLPADVRAAQTALGTAYLEAGRYADAAREAHAAAEHASEAGAVDDGVDAVAVEARALAWAGRVGEASALADELAVHARERQRTGTRMAGLLAAAEVWTLAGRAADASSLAAEVAAEAAGKGMRRESLEALRITGLAASAMGQREGAEAMARVQREARRAGLEGLARRAGLASRAIQRDDH